MDVCVHTCVLINFAIVARMDLLAQIPDLILYVSQEVLNEVTLAEQKQQVEAVVASGGPLLLPAPPSKLASPKLD